MANDIIKELKNTYKPRKIIDDKIFVSRVIYRPISFYLTVPFIKMGFSANGVTWLRLVIALVGIVFLFFGFMISGSSLLFFSALLDYVDGNIARFRKQNSHFGQLLEDISDTFVESLIPFAVSVGLYGDNLFFLIIGAITALAISFRGVVTYRLQAGILKVEATKNLEEKKVVSRKSYNLANYLIFSLRREKYFMLGGILIFAIAGMMNLFLLIRFFASSCYFLFECAQTLVQARRTLNIYKQP